MLMSGLAVRRAFDFNHCASQHSTTPICNFKELVKIFLIKTVIHLADINKKRIWDDKERKKHSVFKETGVTDHKTSQVLFS